MSLRVRLFLLILALVALSTVAIACLELQTLVRSLTNQAVERGEIAGTQASNLMIDRITRHFEELPSPQSLDEVKERWIEIVRFDPEIERIINSTVGLFRNILEISVAGETGEVLISSNPAAKGSPLKHREDFKGWQKTPWYHQVVDLVKRRGDWELTFPIGIQGQAPIFRIQVVTSSLFLRDQIYPEIVFLAEASAAAVAMALVLTLLITNRALAPLWRIERTIDRIVQGAAQADEPVKSVDKEYRVVENKLNLLGQQFRGARADANELRHNVDLLLERMASQLDVAQRLAAISRLSGGVAHEIKNPLNAIVLRLDLLRARLGAPEEELEKEIDILSNEAMRLNRVVKTFLDFSRPLEVNFTELDLGALAREVAELITPQARLSKVAVDCKIPDKPALMRGDPDLLKQAMLNLVTNALEVMPNGGELRVRVVRSESKLILEVEDTGPGIPAELRSKVFQLYFTTKKAGSGIGLAMTYRAAQLHNGTVSFSSESGKGTTFRMELPALVGNG